MKSNKINIKVTGFKSSEGMRFTCYGNVKGNIDHAGDRTMDGAYTKSIELHKKSGTMPKMFWMHQAWETPVGVWHDMTEDGKGLLLSGEFADTEKGRELYQLMKMGALDSFSIGYNVVDEQFNHESKCNDLKEVDIQEISVVTFACNEESRLVGIKSKLEDGEIPTKRELERFLRESGLSRKQSETVSSRYDDSKTDNVVDVFSQIANMCK